MTTKRIPLCQVKGCPHPNDPDWHRCFVCGKQEGDHQHFPKKSLAGKGAKIVAFLCRYHHERITLHEWREGVYTHPDGSKRYYVQNQRGEQQCERIIEAAPTGNGAALSGEGQASSPQETRTHRTRGESLGDKTIIFQGETATGLQPPAVLSDLEPTLESVPDEQLAALFALADKKQAEGFLLKCRIVHTFRERHVQAWGSSWTESAYELFHISRRTLNAYANLHEILDISDRYLIEQIAPLTDSKSLMTYIGRKKVEDGGKALEAAVAYQAEYAEPPSVKALMHKLGEEATPPEACPAGGEHEWGRKCKKCGEER